MNDQDIDKQFQEITRYKPRREPAKFPELRYLWGVSLLGTFLVMFAIAVLDSFIG